MNREPATVIPAVHLLLTKVEFGHKSVWFRSFRIRDAVLDILPDMFGQPPSWIGLLCTQEFRSVFSWKIYTTLYIILYYFRIVIGKCNSIYFGVRNNLLLAINNTRFGKRSTFQIRHFLSNSPINCDCVVQLICVANRKQIKNLERNVRLICSSYSYSFAHSTRYSDYGYMSN